MLKCFTVEGYRNFSTPVSFNFAASRDYQFAENNVKNGTVKTALLIGKMRLVNRISVQLYSTLRSAFQRHSIILTRMIVCF